MGYSPGCFDTFIPRNSVTFFKTSSLRNFELLTTHPDGSPGLPALRMYAVSGAYSAMLIGNVGMRWRMRVTFSHDIEAPTYYAKPVIVTLQIVYADNAHGPTFMGLDFLYPAFVLRFDVRVPQVEMIIKTGTSSSVNDQIVLKEILPIEGRREQLRADDKCR